MLKQLLIGAMVIGLNVAMQAELFQFLRHRFTWAHGLARGLNQRFADTAVITLSVLYVLLIHTIEVWVWAVVLLWLGVFDAVEPALYFSLVAFTTIGFGDITLAPEWRLFSGLMGANGLILFGWSTAFMVSLTRWLDER